MSGDPGCGKSVLSRYLVDEKLQKTNVQSTCFYFFKDLPGRNDATTALRAILHQLFDQQPALLKYAMNDFQRIKASFTQTFDMYWEILLAAAGSAEAHSTVCVLDALDECEGFGLSIIRKLNNLYRGGGNSTTSESKLKFLVTSRPYMDIEREFVELTQTIPTIRLAGEDEPDAINDEIILLSISESANCRGRRERSHNYERLFARLRIGLTSGLYSFSTFCQNSKLHRKTPHQLLTICRRQ